MKWRDESDAEAELDTLDRAFLFCVKVVGLWLVLVLVLAWCSVGR